MHAAETAVTIIFLGLFALVSWFFWLDTKRRRAQIQAASDLQARLLEKFASPQDVAQFLQTEGGRRFLQGLTTDSRHAGRRILTAMQVGVILAFVGLAGAGLGAVYGHEDRGGGIVIGTLILALGLGFLVSAWISYWLSRKWGILDTGKPGADRA